MANKNISLSVTNMTASHGFLTKTWLNVRYLRSMETTELIEFFEANKNTIRISVDLGHGTKIVDTRKCVASHLSTLINPDVNEDSKKATLLRLQRLYDALQVNP